MGSKRRAQPVGVDLGKWVAERGIGATDFVLAGSTGTALLEIEEEHVAGLTIVREAVLKIEGSLSRLASVAQHRVDALATAFGGRVADLRVPRRGRGSCRGPGAWTADCSPNVSIACW